MIWKCGRLSIEQCTDQKDEMGMYKENEPLMMYRKRGSIDKVSHPRAQTIRRLVYIFRRRLTFIAIDRGRWNGQGIKKERFDREEPFVIITTQRATTHTTGLSAVIQRLGFGDRQL